MVKKVCFSHASTSKRNRSCLNLASFSAWRDRHPRLFNSLLAVFVVLIVGVTLIWQQPSIAKKLASTGLDDYFKQDVLDSQKDDADRDGLSDAKEAELKTDSAKPDSDGDGLLDGEEVNTYKTNPLAADTDGDKFSDATEVLTGHDPNRVSSATDSTASSNKSTAKEVSSDNLESISQLLNGDSASSELNLDDLNLDNLTDVSSAFGTGNTAEIVVVDSDIKIIEVPENEAKAKLESYLAEIGDLMMEVFSDEFKDPQASQKFLEAVISSGNFEKLEQTIKKAQLFSDRVVQIAVPAQGKEFHKLLLKTFLELQAVAKSMQQMQSDNLTSLVVLDQVSKLETDLAEFQAAFNLLSTRYEFGYQLETPVTTATDTSSD